MIGFLVSVVGYFTILLYGSTGELLTEKSGNLNLGIPGIMAMGGVFGVLSSFLYMEVIEACSWGFNPWIALIVTMVASMIGSFATTFIYAFLTITLKANQNVTGLALTTFGTGLSNFIGAYVNSNAKDGISAFPAISKIYKLELPFADKLGDIGELFFSHSFMTYMIIVIVFVISFVMKKTRIGLNLRAVGENPATADAAGINVTKYKYFATCIGGVISGLGGLYMLMQYASGGWNKDSIIPFGWLSVAIVIFVVWKPAMGIIGAAVFGALYAISDSILGIPSDIQVLFKLLPYIVTIIVLAVSSIRKKRENQPPESLGVNYFREDR